MFRILMLSLFGVIIGGCATEKAATVNEYLDPETAVTIRAVTEPIVYARDAPELAANVRDYLSAGVVEVNNMGKRAYYLALVSWSTIDRSPRAAGRAPLPGRIEVTVGSRPLELTPVSHEPRRLGIGLPLFRPSHGYAGESWYALTVGDIRAIAGALPMSVDLVDDPAGRMSYPLWHDARRALVDFVHDLPDTATNESRGR